MEFQVVNDLLCSQLPKCQDQSTSISVWNIGIQVVNDLLYIIVFSVFCLLLWYIVQHGQLQALA